MGKPNEGLGTDIKYSCFDNHWFAAGFIFGRRYQIGICEDWIMDFNNCLVYHSRDLDVEE